MIIFESNPAEAKYLLSGDHDTSVTSSEYNNVEGGMGRLGPVSSIVKASVPKHNSA